MKTTIRKPGTGKAGQVIDNVRSGEAIFEIGRDGNLFIPFGSYGHRDGIQFFDLPAASSISARFRGEISHGGGSGAAGIPAYIGMPTSVGGPDPDRGAYGWVIGMNVEKEGLRIIIRWGVEGRRMVADSMFRYLAPAWEVVRQGKRLQPARLHHLGMTNDLTPAQKHGGANEARSGARHDERSAAVGAELARMMPGRPEAERKRIAWQRAAAKDPRLFQ